MKKFLLATCLFIIVSCSKKEELNKTFIGYLDFDFTNSPTMIPAGEKIISNVKIEFPAGGEINFTGFEIKEILPRQFNITANAVFENWNTQISLPAFYRFDTTVSINTTNSGLYILKFYNTPTLFKSDTVIVN